MIIQLTSSKIEKKGSKAPKILFIDNTCFVYVSVVLSFIEFYGLHDAIDARQ